MGFFNGFPDTVLRRKADLVHGKVPAHQLPSFVDDVIEGYYNINDGLFYEDSEFTKQIFYIAQDGTKYDGEKNKIYVDLNNGHDYRWSGTYFVDLHNNASFVDTTLKGTTKITNEIVDNSVVETGEVKTLKSNNATIKQLSLETGTLTTVSNNDLSLVNKKYVDKEVSEIISPSVGIGYQKQYDSALQTNTKTVVGAINELNNKVNTVSGKLQTGWNNVSLNVLYPLGWTFLNKPYAYTDDGVSVDYRVKNLDVSNETIKNNTNTFDIYVPCDCNYVFSTTNSNSISGYPIDYLVVSYYYTGADGKDLDTVTGISNTNWPLSKNTVGYSHGNEIKNNSDITLIYWGGDNTGGGSSNASTKYYESVYFNIKAIQEQLPNEDIDIILYGTWFSELGNGNIYISMDCYTCSNIPTLSTNSNKIITLSGDDLTKTYSNDNNLSCYIPTKKGSPSDYKNAYTPAFKITFKKVTTESNYRTIIIQPLS